jgi:Tol biopolymer transport system component
MGEVYRARDAKLERDVAINVLPAAFASHPDRLDRFEQEARAAGMLNHPNLLSIYEFGMHEGAPYIVSELLEGETLRERLETGDGNAVAIAPRKAIDYATQIANGLAAAHSKGIVHRDLKPENIFITRDGRVKILDFGLAKLAAAGDDSEETEQHTMKRNTAPGTVMGTAGYMSPEQVRGQAVDARSDIFSFGAILYEMLAGRRAFRGGSSVETMNAVLKEDPPDLSSVTSMVPPALQRIVDHCLEKSPDARFQSSRDLAFDLASISGMSDTGVSSIRRPTKVVKWLPWALLLAVLAAGGAYVARRPRLPEQPKLHQLTFRRGIVRSARFAPDGQTIVYAAAWDGGPLTLFQTRANALESVPLQLPSADLLAMSPTGDIAVSLGRNPAPWAGYGTLAQTSMLAAAPRQLLEKVSVAEWTPDGNQLIVVHRLNGQDQLEWPMGKVILRTTGYFDHLRVSRDGKTIAFIDHPVYGDNRGDVVICDAAGKKQVLVKDWAGVEGLAWSPDGKEVWFTADKDGTIGTFEVYGVDLNGRLRSVWQVPTNVKLLDVSSDGRVLVNSGVVTGSVYAKSEGDANERDLAWLAWTSPVHVSADGKLVLLVSFGAGAGRYYATSIRPIDGAPGTRLAEGDAIDLSPDRKWALSAKLTDPPQLLVTPTGAGQSIVVNTKGMRFGGARFLPDNRVIFGVPRSDQTGDLWVVDALKQGVPQSLNVRTPARASNAIPSPDGKWLAMQVDDDGVYVVPLDGGPQPRIAGTTGEDILLRVPDPASIFVSRFDKGAFHVDRVDVGTGRRQHVRDIAAPDMAGAIYTRPYLAVSGDAKTYVTGVTRWLTDLYVVEGLR